MHGVAVTMSWGGVLSGQLKYSDIVYTIIIIAGHLRITCDFIHNIMWLLRGWEWAGTALARDARVCSDSGILS